MPLSRWHVPELRAEAIGRGIVAKVSDPTIWRWLSTDAIRPWAHRSWIFPRDPDFCAKASTVLDLYAGTWQGKRLGKRDFVLSADQKTSIQARIRTHPSTPPTPGQAMRVEREYRRGGAAAAKTPEPERYLTIVGGGRTATEVLGLPPDVGS